MCQCGAKTSATHCRVPVAFTFDSQGQPSAAKQAEPRQSEKAWPSRAEPSPAQSSSDAAAAAAATLANAAAVAVAAAAAAVAA